ncbi:hypothetical protein TUMSATVNIG1_53120 [Vibrio nigripulchritudo]|uniref:HAD hydrolase-like protein n=1 Tax=Vibrio nigripulchritudo TaxID=28173 RepID=UPI00190C6402|nr:HAD hydrolase-like protein [Vibrio nigripulchritudo]BCL73337.1 hypothetical protein VNTUMSATTG_52740 [Vibrio nigripulchritudo]BDU34703.1 hypothetical protein TUMSATVNIG1_53120 [Vibrio nigripulchritudo]
MKIDKHALNGKSVIILDVDGTIIETNQEEESRFFSLLSTCVSNRKIISYNVNSYNDRTFTGILNQCLVDFSVEEQKIIHNRMENNMLNFVKNEEWTAKKSGIGYYNLARKLNCDVYFVTGNWNSCTLVKLSQIGISSNQIYAANKDIFSKRSLINKIINNNTYSLESYLSIGDSEYDELIAKEFGLDFILV